MCGLAVVSVERRGPRRLQLDPGWGQGRPAPWSSLESGPSFGGRASIGLSTMRRILVQIPVLAVAVHAHILHVQVDPGSGRGRPRQKLYTVWSLDPVWEGVDAGGGGLKLDCSRAQRVAGSTDASVCSCSSPHPGSHREEAARGKAWTLGSHQWSPAGDGEVTLDDCDWWSRCLPGSGLADASFRC